MIDWMTHAHKTKTTTTQQIKYFCRIIMIFMIYKLVKLLSRCTNVLFTVKNIEDSSRINNLQLCIRFWKLLKFSSQSPWGQFCSSQFRPRHQMYVFVIILDIEPRFTLYVFFTSPSQTNVCIKPWMKNGWPTIEDPGVWELNVHSIT